MFASRCMGPILFRAWPRKSDAPTKYESEPEEMLGGGICVRVVLSPRKVPLQQDAMAEVNCDLRTRGHEAIS